MDPEKLQQDTSFNKTALVVEDDRICCRVMETYLNTLNYVVDIVTNVKNAIQKLSEQTYALILSDLRLPDKPGTEVIKAARAYETNQGTPFIVMSTQTSEGDFPIYLDLGANAVLIKPVSLEALKGSLQHCHKKPYYPRVSSHPIASHEM